MGKNKLALIFLISAILLVPNFISVTSASTDSSNNNWTMFRNNLNHTGYTSTNSSANSAKLLWTYTTNGSVVSSPAVVNGSLFVGSKDGYFYCLNSSNGKLLWKFGPASDEVNGSPAVDNGRVYVSAYDGFLYCYDIATGQPIWIKWVGGYTFSSPAVADGKVYVGSGKKDLICFNATDGSLIWLFQTRDTVQSSPAVSNGVVYCATGAFAVYAINASTGKEIWNRHTTSRDSSPSICNDSVYIGSYEGDVYDLNASTGDVIWKYQTQDEVISSPAVAYGAVYVGSKDNSVYCLNASTGHKIWQTPTGYWTDSSPALSDGKVYVGSEDYNIYCLNAFTGEIEWNYQTGGYVDSSPAIVNNTLFVGSFDHYVYAFALCNSTNEDSNLIVNSTIDWTTIAFDGIACALGATIIIAVALFVRSTWRIKRKAKEANVPTQNVSWFSAHTETLCLLVILAFSVVFFVNLGKGSLWASDEQTYSQMAFSMVKNQDYLTPWCTGSLAIWTGKPPLTMWLMALSYQVFGINNFSTRLMSALFGTLSLIVVFYLGKRLFNVYAGFLSALVLGTLTTFFAFATHAMLDVPFIFFMLTSIYFLVLGENEEKADLFAVLSGLFFGLALMTKQIDALLIPLIAFVFLASTKRSIRFLFTKRFILFVGVALLIFGPWLIYMNQRFGGLFWETYFAYSVLTRAVSPVEGHVGSYLYYFTYLANNETLLWVILLPFSVGVCLFNILRKRVGDTLILIWITIVFAVFTFSQTKIYYYILPAYPAFALAIGSFLHQLLTKFWQTLPKIKNGLKSA